MNEKLKKWEGKYSSRPRNRGNHGHSLPLSALVHLTKSEGKDKKSGILRISMSYRVLSLTGWQTGDTVDVEFSDGQAVMFRSEDGIKICSPTSGKRCYVRLAYQAGVLDDFPVGTGIDVEALPGRLAFCLPQD